MASADGGQQEPGGSQLAVPDGPQDGGQQQRGGSIVAVPDCPQVLGGGQQMPERLTIGTNKAFENNYPSRTGRKRSGTWTAFDSAVSVDGLTLQCRESL